MFGENIKILRKKKEISQEELARMLGIPRSSYSGYENGIAEPSLAMIVRIADIFKVSTDILLREPLNRYSDLQLKELDRSGDRTYGHNLRVLVTTTDNQQNENIELVPEQAKAGYVSGYSDPDFIRVLPAFNLPFVSRQKKCRAFPVSGDSMPPVSHGSYVICEYVENWRMIRDGFPYVVITKNEGIVFKILYNNIGTANSLQLCSTNPLYKPYEIEVGEVLEVWKFVNYICSEFTDSKPDEEQLSKSLRDLQREVAELRSSINHG